jgi:hypothetical protein
MRAASDIERKLTATSTMQCIYSSVSKASLQKTGVLLNSAGDFREFSPKKFENGATRDFQQLEKPAFGRPFCYLRKKFSETRTAWLATQCRSHPSPRKFPANREFYRENRDFGASGDDLWARSRCAAATYRAIPCAN